MPRKRKQEIKTNSVESLTGLLQEVYDDACGNINSAQKTINELTNAAIPEDVDDLTKIAKETSSALKIKDSAIRIKLEVAKVQNDVLKHKGNEDSAITERSNGSVTPDDFKAIRKMVEENANKREIKD